VYILNTTRAWKLGRGWRKDVFLLWKISVSAHECTLEALAFCKLVFDRYDVTNVASLLTPAVDTDTEVEFPEVPRSR